MDKIMGVSTDYGNSMIRDFMKDGTLEEDISFYTSDWDMLMPVVERVEKLGYVIRISGDYCEIYDPEAGYDEDFTFTGYSFHLTAGSKIEAVWLCVLNFINWYNTQEKNI